MATIQEILSDPTTDWSRQPPASAVAIQSLASSLAILPCRKNICSFLRYCNGGEGVLCIEPWYFRLCPG